MEFHKLVDSQKYPRLSYFLEHFLTMQFADLRCLLRLPEGELNAGCNYATVSVLFNIIGGLSVCLYNASFDDFASSRPTRRGQRFKNLLLTYYPWQHEPVQKETAVEVLYDSLRNPLAHCLGLYKPGEKYGSKVDKNPMDIKQISALESSKTRPDWLNPTVKLSQSIYRYDVNVNTLYWGVNRLIENLLSDKQQLEKAETFLLQLYAAYEIKGLKKNIEHLRTMQKNSPQYINMTNAMKQRLTELLQLNQLTEKQKNGLQQLRKEYNMLT